MDRERREGWGKERGMGEGERDGWMRENVNARICCVFFSITGEFSEVGVNSVCLFIYIFFVVKGKSPST